MVRSFVRWTGEVVASIHRADHGAGRDGQQRQQQAAKDEQQPPERGETRSGASQGSEELSFLAPAEPSHHTAHLCTRPRSDVTLAAMVARHPSSGGCWEGQISRRRSRVKISEVLRDKGTSVITAHPVISVSAAARRMHDAHIGAMIVSGDGERIDGIISERDIVYAIARDHATLDAPVSSVMTTEVITVKPDDTVNKAMELMTRHRCRHLPVLRDGELAGIVSIGDLVKARLNELELESRVLRDVVIASH
jgi:CBS domain-containing protein